jgi:hypothetical protein
MNDSGIKYFNTLSKFDKHYFDLDLNRSVNTIEKYFLAICLCFNFNACSKMFGPGTTMSYRLHNLAIKCFYKILDFILKNNYFLLTSQLTKGVFINSEYWRIGRLLDNFSSDYSKENEKYSKSNLYQFFPKSCNLYHDCTVRILADGGTNIYMPFNDYQLDDPNFLYVDIVDYVVDQSRITSYVKMEGFLLAHVDRKILDETTCWVKLVSFVDVIIDGKLELKMHAELLDTKNYLLFFNYFKVISRTKNLHLNDDDINSLIIEFHNRHKNEGMRLHCNKMTRSMLEKAYSSFSRIKGNYYVKSKYNAAYERYMNLAKNMKESVQVLEKEINLEETRYLLMQTEIIASYDEKVYEQDLIEGVTELYFENKNFDFSARRMFLVPRPYNEAQHQKMILYNSYDHLISNYEEWAKDTLKAINKDKLFKLATECPDGWVYKPGALDYMGEMLVKISKSAIDHFMNSLDIQLFKVENAAKFRELREFPLILWRSLRFVVLSNFERRINYLSNQGFALDNDQVLMIEHLLMLTNMANTLKEIKRIAHNTEIIKVTQENIMFDAFKFDTKEIKDLFDKFDLIDINNSINEAEIILEGMNKVLPKRVIDSDYKLAVCANYTTQVVNILGHYTRDTDEDISRVRNNLLTQINPIHDISKANVLITEQLFRHRINLTDQLGKIKNDLEKAKKIDKKIKKMMSYLSYQTHEHKEKIDKYNLILKLLLKNERFNRTYKSFFEYVKPSNVVQCLYAGFWSLTSSKGMSIHKNNALINDNLFNLGVTRKTWHFVSNYLSFCYQLPFKYRISIKNFKFLCNIFETPYKGRNKKQEDKERKDKIKEHLDLDYIDLDYID